MKLLLFCTLLISQFAMAQIGTPLNSDSDTIALWNFDSDTGSDVLDTSGNANDGENFGTTLIAVPAIDPSFSLGRQVTGENQFIDFGVTQGGTFDFQGANELSVEAIIRVAETSDDEHIIFTTDQVQLMVVGGKLGGFIRTASGFRGVVSNNNLSLDTNYRVGVHKLNSTLAITINGKVENSVQINEPIVAPSYASARVTIGGNIFNQYFKGHIDDVRVSSVKRVDITSPSITKNLPDTFVVDESKPDFDFSLSDSESGVDATSVQVYLNDVLQNGLAITNSSITGQMDDPMSPITLNEVKVIFADLAGNTIEQIYTFSFANVGGKTPYENDADTLALWHMDDFTLSMMMDSSSNGFHGFADSRYQSIGLGVFNTGRYFQGASNSHIEIGSIKIPGDEFTFESWVMPTGNDNNEEIILDSGQIKVARFNGGHVRVVFTSTQSDETFETTTPVIPVGEQHHLAITWNGNIKTDNLKIYIDGAIQASFDACISCDLNPFPAVGTIGNYFSGMLDEMRFSSVIRSTFNIPNTDQRSIDFLSLDNGTSTNIEYPELHVSLNSSASITPSNVKVKLNGVEQVADANLVITSNSIDGTFNDAAELGINYIDISFVDDSGNSKNKAQYFFYVKENSIAYNISDANTVGIWSFERDARFKDTSGNGFDFDERNFEEVTGTLGNGIRSGLSMDNLEIQGRSLTVDGFVKRVPNYNGQIGIYRINGSQFDLRVNMIPSTGDMNFYLNTPEFTINKTVSALFPSDEEYHHLAVVYDSSRAHGQFLVILDGEVVQVIDIDRSCNFAGDLTYSLGNGSYFDMDEFRISNIARYEFNSIIDNQNISISSSVTEMGTITTSDADINLNITSQNGISNTGNQVFVNGVLEENLTFTQSGNSAELSGILEHAIAGANFIKVIASNTSGSEQSSTFLFYKFLKLPVAEYVSDADTMLLMHFEETAGTVFSDSSANSYDFIFDSWTLGETGVFGNAANTYSDYAESTINSYAGLDTYTIEAWREGFSGGTGYFFQLGTYLDFSRYYSNPYELRFRTSSSDRFDASKHIIGEEDGWHHYAVVVDANHPYRQVYLLEDGIVVNSHRVDDLTDIELNDQTNARFGGALRNNNIDELRVSAKARYELVSDPN